MFQIINYAVIAIVFVVFFIWASKRKSKLGINLKRKYCPVCGAKQPFVRIPKSLEQAFFGGTICPKCQTRLDKYGQVIP